MSVDIHLGDNLDVLPSLPSGAFDLVYIDPPFNTGRAQRGVRTRAVADADAGRAGFRGRRYRTTTTAFGSYDDRFDDLPAWLAPRFDHALRLLAPTGSLFVHLDPREAHYVKVQLDGLFGRRCFQNEIIWAYDFGGRARRRWSGKHDTILWYTRDPDRYTFNFDAIDRVPYMAPDLVGPEKAARGKTATDVWWHTIVPTSG
jgi:site-specific DNA-methyltransferase (adenine-specific)